MSSSAARLNHNVVHSTGNGPSPQLVERSASALDRKVAEHVDWPGVGGPRRTPEAAKRWRIDRHRELACFVVGHTADAQPCVQLGQSGGETCEVVVGAARHDVDVEGLTVRSMGPRTEPADDHELHAVSVEDSDDPFWVERAASVSWHACLRLRAGR